MFLSCCYAVHALKDINTLESKLALCRLFSTQIKHLLVPLKFAILCMVLPAFEEKRFCKKQRDGVSVEAQQRGDAAHTCTALSSTQTSSSTFKVATVLVLLFIGLTAALVWGLWSMDVDLAEDELPAAASRPSTPLRLLDREQLRLRDVVGEKERKVSQSEHNEQRCGLFPKQFPPKLRAAPPKRRSDVRRVIARRGVPVIVDQPISEGLQRAEEVSYRTMRASLQSWPYWPRPFGLNAATSQTRAGRGQQRLMGYVRENDDGDHNAAHVDAVSVDKSRGVGRPPVPARRWQWPAEHSASWVDRWEQIAFGSNNGTNFTTNSRLFTSVGSGDLTSSSVSPPVIPQLAKPWARHHVRKLMTSPMMDGIRTLAKAFMAYDERVQHASHSKAAANSHDDDSNDVNKNNKDDNFLLADVKARLTGIDHQPDVVPAYATICGDNDCGVLSGHFLSVKTLGRFILILNSADEHWVALCRMLEEAFPDRYIVEYAMAKTLRLRAEQLEYERRHNTSDGIEELTKVNKHRIDTNATATSSSDGDLQSKEKEEHRIAEVEVHFKEQDAADDVLDITTNMSTAYYRWHLRNLAPEQLTVPLGVHHSVAMSWNRILHICFRGNWPVDYVFIANGDFYLINDSLSRFATHVFNVTRFGPERLRTLSAFQEGLPFSFFAHTYDAWRRFGEYDESIYPLYAEDNEFLLRIRSSGRELAAAYDEVYPKSKDFFHYRSMSQRHKRDANIRLFINMIWDRRKTYLEDKYAPFALTGAYVSPFMGALRSAFGAFPFNNTAISLRNTWAIDVRYRGCILKPTDTERRACPPMDAKVIERLITTGTTGRA